MAPTFGVEGGVDLDVDQFVLAPGLGYPRRRAAVLDVLGELDRWPDADYAREHRDEALRSVTPLLQATALWEQTRSTRTYTQDRAHYRLHGASRPKSRVIVAMTAEMVFASYAAGYWQATQAWRTTLRGDLSGACALVWTWANVEYRVLSAVLGEALRDDEDNPLAFPAFTRLFELVFGLHLLGDQSRRAEVVSTVAVDALRHTTAGATALARLTRPVVRALDEHSDDDVRLRLDDRQPSREEVLAKAAVPVLQDVRSGALAMDEAEAALRRVFNALRTVG